MVRRARWPIVLCLGALLALTLPAPAAQPAPQVVLAGQIELARLVDLAAQRLKLDIEYDASQIKGTVTLRLGAGVSDEELWTLVNRVLAARGWTTVRTASTGAISIVRLAEAANLSALEAGRIDGGGTPAVTPGFRTAVIRVQNRPMKEIVEAVGKILSKPGGQAVPLGDQGLLLISDLDARLDQILELLARLDAPSQAVVREIALRNITPASLVPLVGQIVAKRESVTGQKIPGEVIPSPNAGGVLLLTTQEHEAWWGQLIADLDSREHAETRTYSGGAFGIKDVAKLIEQTIKDGAGDDRWKIVNDELTNALIITATPGQHEKIRALMDRLAATPSAGRRPVRTFVIRNRPVKELAQILQSMTSAGLIGEESAGPAGASPQPAPPASATPPTDAQTSLAQGNKSPPTPARSFAGGGKAVGDDESPLLIAADEATNTIIASGEPRLLEQVDGLIKTLDVRQPQVMLEVMLLTLNESQSLSLGVELQKLSSVGGSSVNLASLFGLSTASGNSRSVADGLGFTGTVLNPGDFALVVRALETLSNGRSLSMPKLLVGNNQQAVLDSVLEQPFTSTNASSTVATTSFGGSARAGTQVTIKPQIAQADHLILEYQIGLSSFVGAAASANVPPPRQENKVQSVATIPDGHTVVVGGINLNTESDTVSQVPVLGSIPLLGELFKNRSLTNSHSKFYVFIRASVLRARNLEDLRYISDREASANDIEDDSPPVEPGVIR